MTRCVHHLLSLLVRTIERQIKAESGGALATDDCVITPAEMKAWIALWKERSAERVAA